MSRRDLPSAEWLEQVLNVCLEQGDIEGVGHALRLLAVQDPRRAELLYQTMRVGVAIRTEHEGARQVADAHEQHCTGEDEA